MNRETHQSGFYFLCDSNSPSQYAKYYLILLLLIPKAQYLNTLSVLQVNDEIINNPEVNQITFLKGIFL